MVKQKKGVTEKIINFILNVFITVFSIVLLISVYNNLQVKLFGKDYSDFFGYSLFEVQTGSMSPEINPGDWIIVKATKNIKLKDIVTYKQGNEFITHRVIGTYNSTYVTKGDANNSKDDPIDQKQVVGKVVKILPNFGLFKKTVFNPVVLAAIIITILICDFVFKKNTKEKSKLEENKIIIKVKEKINVLKEKINMFKEKNNTKKEFNLKNTIIEISHKKDNKKIEDTTTLKIEEEYNEVLEEIKLLKKVETENKGNEDFDDIPSFIPVDASELDETFLEIAQNEIDEEEPKILNTNEIIEEQKEEQTTTKINLDLFQ